MKKIEEKIENHICSLFFPLFSYTLFNCIRNGPLFNCKKKRTIMAALTLLSLANFIWEHFVVFNLIRIKLHKNNAAV